MNYGKRKVWKFQSGNQKLQIEAGQWPKEKGQDDK